MEAVLQTQIRIQGVPASSVPGRLISCAEKTWRVTVNLGGTLRTHTRCTPYCSHTYRFISRPWQLLHWTSLLVQIPTIGLPWPFTAQNPRIGFSSAMFVSGRSGEAQRGSLLSRLERCATHMDHGDQPRGMHLCATNHSPCSCVTPAPQNLII